MAGLGVTDSGIINAASIAQLAAAAVAVYNTVVAVEMAEKQEDLAKKYLKIAQEQEQYYYDVYVPCENTEITEACSAEEYTAHYDIQAGRYKTSVSVSLAGQIQKQLSCVSRYCTGKKEALIDDMINAQDRATSAAINLGKRYETAYKDAMDDLRWARRAAALARGRDMMAQAATFSSFAYGIFGSLGKQAAAGAAGAIGYLGYSMNRNETQYPQRAQREYQAPQYGISYPLPSPELEINQQQKLMG